MHGHDSEPIDPLDHEQTLFYALKKNDLKKVENVLSKFGTFNAKIEVFSDEDGNPPMSLLKAAEQFCPAAVPFIREKDLSLID